MYLMLAVAGELTIFQTRTRGPFWSVRPAPILFAAVCGMAALATLIAVFGVFMTPLGWVWAAVVWAYVVVWFLVTDGVKLLVYWILGLARPVAAARPGAASVMKPAMAV